MAQIIQYKDRLLDTSVYPVTTAAAVYVRTSNDSSLNTLDTVLDTKVESIKVLIDSSLDGTLNYTCVANIDQDFTDNDKETIQRNIGIDKIVIDLKEYTDNKIQERYNNKQDKLFHGITTGNLKTINNANIIGPGNVEIGLSDRIINVDNTLDIDSSNAISNKTITSFLTWAEISK